MGDAGDEFADGGKFFRAGSIGFGWIESLDGFFEFSAGGLKIGSHLVERMAERAEFVVALDFEAFAEIAAADGFGGVRRRRRGSVTRPMTSQTRQPLMTMPPMLISQRVACVWRSSRWECS